MRAVLVVLLLGRTAADHDYFQYEDCGKSCTRQESPCTISVESGDFVTRCCGGEDCLARISDTVVCLRPEEPPRGGGDIWGEFKRKVYPSLPTVAPIVREDCTRLKVLMGLGWASNAMVILFILGKLAIRKLRPELVDEEADVFHNPNYRPPTPEVEANG